LRKRGKRKARTARFGPGKGRGEGNGGVYTRLSEEKSALGITITETGGRRRKRKGKGTPSFNLTRRREGGGPLWGPPGGRGKKEGSQNKEVRKIRNLEVIFLFIEMGGEKGKKGNVSH